MSALAIAHALIYTWEWSVYRGSRASTNRLGRPRPRRHARVTIDGLAPGQLYWFRVRAFLRDRTTTDYVAPVSLMMILIGCASCTALTRRRALLDREAIGRALTERLDAFHEGVPGDDRTFLPRSAADPRRVAGTNRARLGYAGEERDGAQGRRPDPSPTGGVWLLRLAGA